MTEPPTSVPVAVVVGGGSGIGFASAARLVSRGVPCHLFGRDQARLTGGAQRLHSLFTEGQVWVHAVDAQDLDQLQDAFAGIVATGQRIDTVVSCAGTFAKNGFLDLDPTMWRRAIGENLDSMAFVSAVAARFMADGEIGPRGGRIVLTSSIDEIKPEPDVPAYNAAKAATSALVRSLALDLSGQGIIANAVAPGYVRTEMTFASLDALGSEKLKRVNLLGRAADPDEIARVVEFLCLDAPDFLLGQTLFVDGGQQLVGPFQGMTEVVS